MILIFYAQLTFHEYVNRIQVYQAFLYKCYNNRLLPYNESNK